MGRKKRKAVQVNNKKENTDIIIDKEKDVKKEENNSEQVKEKTEENIQEIAKENENQNEVIKETVEKKEDSSSNNEKEVKDIVKVETNSVTINEEKNKINRKTKIILIVVSFFIIIILAFSGIVCFNKLNDKVYKNIYVLNENIGCYTADELRDFLSKKNEVKLEGKIDFYEDTEKIYTITKEDINLKIDVEKTIQDVMNYGREGNIFKTNFEIFEAALKGKNVEVSYSYDKDKLDEIVKNVELSIKNGVVQSKYSIDEENKKLVVVIGKTGNTIDFDTEKEKIFENIKNTFLKNSDETKIYIDIKKKKPDELNYDEIYKAVKRDAKDAYVDKSSNPIKIVSEQVGYDIDKDLLISTLNKEENKVEGKEIQIELKVIEPNVKLENLEAELYKDKLAGYTTYFPAGRYARSNNLEIALRYLNGKVVMPGSVFSYNDAIGDTTAAKGYQAAATFKGGTTVNEMGGGICQTVSTLYNVVLMANLEVVERHAHGLPVGYVQPSRDATVYSPYLDFKFKNTRNYPIKIITSFTYEGSLNISFYGIREETEYDIDVISQYLATVPFTTKYIYDENMPEGTSQVITAGVNGYTSQSFLSKKLNGVQVSYDFLSKDTYNPQQQVVKVGTKKNQQENNENSSGDTKTE